MEYLIVNGSSHVIVDEARDEAMSFSDYGVFISEVQAKPILVLNALNKKPVSVLSIIYSNRFLDIMIGSKRATIPAEKPISLFINLIKSKLPIVSIVPYKMSHQGINVIHTLLLLKEGTTYREISNTLGVPIDMWEDL